MKKNNTEYTGLTKHKAGELRQAVPRTWAALNYGASAKLDAPPIGTAAKFQILASAKALGTRRSMTDSSLNVVKPTRIEFERQLRRLQGDVLRMGALVENSCWLARKSLFERDLEAARQIAVQDKQIDQFYRQIELGCVNLMAIQASVTHDIRLLSAMMQLVRDLERIGDYAEDLGEIAVKLFPYPADGCMDQVQVMFDRCRAMLAMSLAALSDLNAESGLDIKQKDDAVDDDYEMLYNLLAHQTNVQGTIEPIVLLVLVIRHLERMADHATNIGKRVAYIVTGQR